MRLKEKLYRRFCAPEVRMLLDHMEENFEDFVDDYNGRKTWVRLLDAKDYSKIERKTIEMVFKRLKQNRARQQLLGRIIAQKLNPEPEKKSDDFMDAHRYATALNQKQHQMAQQQLDAQIRNHLGQYAQQAASQYQQDPRAMYGRTP
jgi:wyosine [tRNA(Phe)-imidazoG37] synthetase (radical SAM superfamily)